MADNSKNQAGGVNQDSLDSIQSLQSKLNNVSDTYDEINKKAKIYNTTTRDTLSKTTELNHIFEDSKNMLGKINIEIIKEQKYKALLTKIEVELGKLYAKRKELDKGNISDQNAILKIIEEKEKSTIKINSDNAIANLELIRNKDLQLAIDSKIKENQKSKNYSASTHIKLEERLMKAFEDEEDLQKRIISNASKLAGLTKDIATLHQTDNISTKRLTDEQILSLQHLYGETISQEEAIKKSNKALQKSNFLREIFNKLGLSSLADSTKHMENFGLKGAIALGAITLIAVAAKALIESFFQIDKQTTDIANTLGISKKGAELLRDEFARVSLQNEIVTKGLDESLLSITNQVNAMSQLNEAFGIAGVYTNNQLQDQIKLTKMMGLEAEDASKLQMFGIINAKSADQTANSILDQVVNLQKETGIRLQGRNIVKEVAKVEGQLAVLYKNNPGLIAKAIVQAKRYGLTLEETKKSSESLLDFESSISNELEAELVTGKKLNFEKAREFALQGDTTKAATELVKQVGSLSEFQKLNVIQQNTLAKSIGLSSDELSNSLRLQELLKFSTENTKNNLEEVRKKYASIGKEAEFNQSIQSATNGEQLNAQISQLSAQAQFEEGLQRIKDTFAQVFTKPFLDELQGVVKSFAESLPTIIRSITTLGSFVGGIADLFGGGSDSHKYENVHDSVINKKGRITISTPQGDIVPDRNDSIITTTNPQGLVSGGKADNSELVSKLDKLISLIEKGGNVYLDSKKVGTTQAIAYNSYK